MKKLVLAAGMLSIFSGAYAQELTSKKGEAILPEATDWAISFDASPIFNYFGNMFHGQNQYNGVPGVNFVNANQTIVAKKFIDYRSAYRASLRIGFVSGTDKNSLALANQTVFYPNLPTMVEDKFKSTNTTIGLGFGKEWRKGRTRLQGFYGVDGMVWFSNSSTKYTYGNDISTTVSVAGNTTDFGDNLVNDIYGNNARILKSKVGSTFGIGVRGFIGAEYFILPKISLGAEYGWGIGLQFNGKRSTETESMGMNNAGTMVKGNITTENGGGTTFGFDTDINNGGINMGLGSGTGTLALKATFHF
jgi:hypothetical protein